MGINADTGFISKSLGIPTQLSLPPVFDGGSTLPSTISQ